MVTEAPDVAEHARFFDHLVELIPAKHYYEDNFAKVNPRFLAKAARAAYHADAKQKAKDLKRARLDPEIVETTLEVQQRLKGKQQQQRDAAAAGADANGAKAGKGKQAKGKAAPAATSDAGAASAAASAPGAGTAAGLQLQLSGAALSRQELLERLHKKVEESRARRKAGAESAAEAKEWRANALKSNAAAKQKQQQQGQQGQKGKPGQQAAAAGGKRKAEGEAGGKPGQGKGPAGQGQQGGKKARREEGGEAADFKFARIELEEGGRGKGPGSKRPPKQVLLKQAEAHKAELESLAGTEEGKAKAQAAAWKSALARAGGEKVLDDPKLLRRSLKRESKRKEKHGKAWQERKAAQQEAQAARQAKRSDNLAARRQTKMDNKKAKREKKLLRPGFEGRKEGFIATGGGAAK